METSFRPQLEVVLGEGEGWWETRTPGGRTILGLMKFPSVYLYKETLSKNTQVPAKKLSSRFGKIFPAVWGRADLSLGAKVVLGGVAIWGRGEEVVGMSHGYLAGVCGMSRSTVAIGLEALEVAGLIRKEGEKVGQVQRYRVLYEPMLKEWRGMGGSGVVREFSRKVTADCRKCGKKARLDTRTGWCKACRTVVEQEATMRRIAQTVVAQAVAERLAG